MYDYQPGPVSEAERRAVTASRQLVEVAIRALKVVSRPLLEGGCMSRGFRVWGESDWRGDGIAAAGRCGDLPLKGERMWVGVGVWG